MNKIIMVNISVEIIIKTSASMQHSSKGLQDTYNFFQIEHINDVVSYIFHFMLNNLQYSSKLHNIGRNKRKLPHQTVESFSTFPLNFLQFAYHCWQFVSQNNICCF